MLAACASLGATGAWSQAPALPEPVLTRPAADTATLSSPGWIDQVAQPVTPDEARAARRPVISQEQRRSARTALAPFYDYTALAEALENDPRRIYQFVRNNIEYVPYFGALKGPYLTLMERAGNDFDQAALFIELLRAADVTANYRYGVASINVFDPTGMQRLADWLRVENDPNIVIGLLSNGGMPVTIAGGTNIEFERVWVEAQVGGQTVSLDPAFKESTRGAVTDISSVSGFSRNDFLAAAGGTVTADSIEGMSTAGVNNYLSGLTNQLLAYIDANAANASIEEVIGGFVIEPDYSSSLPASLPLPMTPSEAPWATIPAAFLHTLDIGYGNIDISVETREIAGRKVSLTFTGGDVVIPAAPSGSDDLGSVDVGGTGGTLSFNLAGLQSQSVTVESSLSGSGAAAFEFTAGGGQQVIPAGGSGSVTVRLTGVGQQSGRKNATLSIQYIINGNPQPPQTADLTGAVLPERPASLFVDDVLLVSEATSSGGNPDLQLAIDHPYAANGGTFADQTSDIAVQRGGTYVLVSAFGGDANSILLAERQRQLKNLNLQGAAADSPELVSEVLNVMGQAWMRQTQLARDVLSLLSDTSSIRHHRFGVTGQEESYYIDIPMQFVSTSFTTSVGRLGSFETAAFIASAMEHSVLEQYQGIANPALSTAKIIGLNNDRGGRLYRIDASNFNAVQPLLQNYSVNQLNQFIGLLNQGGVVVAPQDGSIALNQWSGTGYVEYLANGASRSVGMIIGGGLNGGFASQPQFIDGQFVISDAAINATPPGQVITPKGADPVDMASGAFLSELTDLAIAGQGSSGLEFTRSYNSAQSGENRVGLGRGWTHNYDIALSETSQTDFALGKRTIRDIAPLTVALNAMLEVFASGQLSVEEWGVNALTANWMMDRLLTQTVTIRQGDRASTYQKMPDGRFISPPDAKNTLERLGDGRHELRGRYGDLFVFGTDGRIQTITDRDGNVRNFTYSGDRLASVTDSRNRTLTISYAADALVGVTDFSGRSISYGQTGDLLTSVDGLEGDDWEYTYDQLGRLLTVTDPVGVTIVDNTYDDHDRVTEQRAPRDSGSETYRFHYGGLLSSEEDPLGHRMTYFYDYAGLTVAVEDSQGAVFRIGYDGQGHIVRETDPNGQVATQQFDPLGNRVTAIDTLGNPTQFVVDASSLVQSIVDPAGNSVEFDYDANNRVVASRDGVGNQTTKSYRSDGLSASTTNPRGFTTTLSYDSNGYPSGSQVGGSPGVTMSYNNRGQLLSLTDEGGTSTQFLRNARGLETAMQDAFGNSRTTTYDGLGRITSQTDRNGQTTNITYTGSGKIRSISRPGEVVNFSYDSRDNAIRMTDTLGQTDNVFDGVGRLVGSTDANGFTVTYDYDLLGNITQLTYPDGKSISYTYDALSRIASVSIDWLGVSAVPTYDAAGRMTRLVNFNGSVTTYGYDNTDRLTSLAHTVGGSVVADYQFQLDGSNNRTSTVASAVPIAADSGFLQPATTSFTVDRNRVVQSDDGSSSTGLVYDAEGQLASKGGVNFAFDTVKRLTSYGANTYQYDGLGNRLVATRNGETSRYLYDSDGNVIAEANGVGAITRYYIHGLGLQAMVDAQSNALYVYHFDGTGHTVAMSDSGGALVNRYAYTAYGRVLAKDEQVPQPFGYAGRYGIMTEPDGLLYMRARYYDTATARFISEDPAGFDGGINLYAYVGGNPVAFVDPSGEIPLLVIIPVVGGLITGGIDAVSACASGCSFSEGAKAFGTGFVAGAAGTATGMAVGAASFGNPVAAGASGSFVSSGVKQLIKGEFDGVDLLISTGTGAVLGPLGGKVAPTKGFLPNLATPRNAANWGKNSSRLVYQELVGSTAGNVTGLGTGALRNFARGK